MGVAQPHKKQRAIVHGHKMHIMVRLGGDGGDEGDESDESEW